ncbi:MAG: M15 family metallopeptidase [Ruminococcus sp.]|nr:M15 family metallopeptidase [Ruminococcus sp.]
MKKNGTKWELMGETKQQSFTITGIGLDRDYIFTVKAYKLIDGKKLYSERSRNCGFPYMTKKDGVTYVDGLLVVNKTYGLPASYGWGLTSETQAAFSEMQKGAAADGLSIWICSGFRSYSYQSTLYWNYVARDGSQWSADRYSARPGFSEHQSGYAVDVNQASRYFNGSPVAVWLEKNCWKYGFIIRYPFGKEDITGYNYESWHCRYVGKEKAKRLTESGLTIEEYYGLTSVYS